MTPEVYWRNFAASAAGPISTRQAIWGPQGFTVLTGAPGAADKIPSGPPGEPFLIETFGLISKRWPCCGYLARIVDARVDLNAEGLNASDVEAITLRAPPRNAAILIYDQPETPDQARFSAPYCAAISLMNGLLTPGDFAENAIKREGVLAFAARIDFASTSKPQSNVDLDPADPDEITIRLMNGEVITRDAAHMRGGPEQPMTRADFFEKLRLCAPPTTDITVLTKALTDLPTAPDLTEITRHISQPKT